MFPIHFKHLLITNVNNGLPCVNSCGVGFTTNFKIVAAEYWEAMSARPALPFQSSANAPDTVHS